MGPAAENSTSSSSIKVTHLPKLKDDLSNWVTYKERVSNTLIHKGLRRHAIGSAKPPAVPELRENGDYYPPGRAEALSEEELEEAENKLDAYLQKEASVREVIYETVNRTTFLQVKNEPTAAAVWKKLTSICEDKGELTQLDILTKLQNLTCGESDNVRQHLANMSEIQEELAGMGAPVSDPQFATMIRRSLPPSYRPLLQSTSMAARITGKAMTSSQLIQCIHEEADIKAVDQRSDENSAMMASRNGNSTQKGKRRDGNKTCK